MNFPSKEIVKRVKEDFPEGTRVRLVQMDDPFNTTLKSGDEGTVRFVDDTATIHVNWDCGSGLGIVYGVDAVTKI